MQGIFGPGLEGVNGLEGDNLGGGGFLNTPKSLRKDNNTANEF